MADIIAEPLQLFYDVRRKAEIFADVALNPRFSLFSKSPAAPSQEASSKVIIKTTYGLDVIEDREGTSASYRLQCKPPAKLLPGYPGLMWLDARDTWSGQKWCLWERNAMDSDGPNPKKDKALMQLDGALFAPSYQLWQKSVQRNHKELGPPLAYKPSRAAAAEGFLLAAWLAMQGDNDYVYYHCGVWPAAPQYYEQTEFECQWMTLTAATVNEEINKFIQKLDAVEIQKTPPLSGHIETDLEYSMRKERKRQEKAAKEVEKAAAKAAAKKHHY